MAAVPDGPSTTFPPEFARLRGSARLAVYIDLKSPYAFIAIGPTRDMARARDVEATAFST